MCLAVLPGCLPDDVITYLRYSPDGQLLAGIFEEKGLFVADPTGMEKRIVAPVSIEPAAVEWMDDSTRLVFTSGAEGSVDLYVSSLDGVTTRLTTMPGRETSPRVIGGLVLYTSTESGYASVTSASLSGDDPEPGVRLPVWENPVYSPALSPGGDRLAWVGNSNLCPQVYVASLHTGAVEQVTSETDSLSLLSAPVQWSPGGDAIYYLRNRPQDGVMSSSQFANDSTMPGVYRGTDLCALRLDSTRREETIASEARGIDNPTVLPSGEVVYVTEGKVNVIKPGEKPRQLSLDLQASIPAGGGDDEIAFVVARQLVGTSTASLERSRIFTFDMEDKFLLAEEYFRSGSDTKSYDLYEELAASVQRTRDPQMARLVYIANLRRLGKNAKAIEEMESLAADGLGNDAGKVKYLWRMLGFSHLLEFGQYGKARQYFARYREMTSVTANLDDPDSALNALEILDAGSTAVISLYARAVKARLNGDFRQTDRLFGELLASAKSVEAVHREYLNALGGFDSEVYYFTPSQKPFEPTRFQQAEYLERFVGLAPDSPLARGVRLDLFLLRIELGSYSRARMLLKEEMAAEDVANARPEGILEVFRNYLETPEPQPWINQAIPEVFLHNEIRPMLEQKLPDARDQFLLGVVAVKMALLQNKPDLARKEADQALAQWRRIEEIDHDAELLSCYGRLLTFRAREAELSGLYGEAAESYGNLLQVLTDNAVDNFEFQEEVRYRAQLLTLLITEFPHELERLKQVEIGTGTELINPTWEREVLEAAVAQQARFYQDSTTGSLKAWAACETGQAFAKLQRHEKARDALLLAVSATAPEFVRRKALLELAALDELDNDAWNAARSYARIAAMPSTSQDVRLWCSYQIARLHLSINFKTSAARDALAVIVSTRPDTPLAIQAQELLVATSVR